MIRRIQFTRKDSELHPECDNSDYLDYEWKYTNVSGATVISYGYCEQVGVAGYRWVKKSEVRDRGMQ